MFEVKQTIHNMPGIELIGGNPEHHALLRNASTTQWMNNKFYQAKTKAGAFLQGQADDNPMWTLVEFWRPEYQEFVDLLNQSLGEKGK